jgi:glycosyltransferase involved in cell wall biosynthesis
VIAVDDRSDDDTGAIMDRLARGDHRLRVIHVVSLPNDWLGKNHALQLGASQAAGEYLLFTDGDILFTPDALQRAVRYAVHSRIDHLCLIPRMISGGYWENALTAFFGLVFSAGTFAWLVPTPLKWAYAGVGAFNLVRTEAYKDAGGHEPIRLDVLDDVKLGKLMKRSGFRADILAAGRFVRVKWQETATGVIGGLEKNAFAAVDYSLLKLVAVTITLLIMLYLPYTAVLLVPDVQRLGYLASVVLVHGIYAVFGQRFGVGWLVCPALPAAGLLMLWAFWRSAWVTLRQGGVRWRETFYPLQELRRKLYR